MPDSCENYKACFAFLILMITCLILQSDAGKICKILKPASAEQNVRPTLMKCCLCGEQPNSFRMLASEPESVNGKADFTPYLAKIKVITIFVMIDKSYYLLFLQYFLF